MPTKVWTDATMTFTGCQGNPPGSDWHLVVEPAWTSAASMNGSTGTVVYTSPPTMQFGVGSLLDDDATVPLVITMSTVRIQFDYAVTCDGGTQVSDGSLVNVDLSGNASGSYDNTNDALVYFGGTDRATMFSVGVFWVFRTIAPGSTHQAVTVSNYTVTITYTATPPPEVTRLRLPPLPTRTPAEQGGGRRGR